MALEHSAPALPSQPHLCVLVHGLWGNPAHLEYLRKSIEDKYADEELHVLVAKRNSGSFTYDGVETGGERVTCEIEEKLEELSREGHEVKRISIIGYSLGGLISRYAIGLLYHKGLFDKIEPVNFTTFATPHLGVRSPRVGTRNHLFNVLGARTLSMSGRQLFTIDNFRDTNRPLLAVLADPNSIFIKGLTLFKHRSLYANVTNDKTVTYYTAGISQTDPFVSLDKINCNYVEGYEPVILDGENPYSVKEPEVLPAFPQRVMNSLRGFWARLPITLFFIFFVPIGSTLFLINSAIQHVRSQQRIRLHETGRAGIDIHNYRIPLINDVRQELEDMFENMNNRQDQEYLPTDSEEMAAPTQPQRLNQHASSRLSGESLETDTDETEELKKEQAPKFPTLALTAAQFAMIEALDNVGFKKFPVYIHKHTHTHAAIIYRRHGPAFEEGWVVAKHWLSTFEL